MDREGCKDENERMAKRSRVRGYGNASEQVQAQGLFSKACQKEKFMSLRLKRGEGPDEFCTAIAAPEIEYRNNFEEEDKL